MADAPRSGAPREIGDEEVERPITLTLEAVPAGATHRSTRSLAERAGMSQTAVSRIRRAFGLRPHRPETFELSSDPASVGEVRDVVGLYLDPPDRALVRCADEKPQIRALERTAPVPPMRPGRAARRGHDHKRHGTTDPFAALDVHVGTVIGGCRRRHRAVEVRAFLDRVEAAVPADLDVHLVLDNAAIHETRLVRDWLVERPRWHLHVTPTGASWLNPVECGFAVLTRRRLERGVFTSGEALENAIRAHSEQTNAEPRPFAWTKSADDILASVSRFRQRTSNSDH